MPQSVTQCKHTHFALTQPPRSEFLLKRAYGAKSSNISGPHFLGWIKKGWIKADVCFNLYPFLPQYHCDETTLRLWSRAQKQLSRVSALQAATAKMVGLLQKHTAGMQGHVWGPEAFLTAPPSQPLVVAFCSRSLPVLLLHALLLLSLDSV